MNILVTLNQNYIIPLCSMLKSLAATHPCSELKIYVMNRTFTSDNYKFLQSNIDCDNIVFYDIKVEDSMLSDAPVTNRYPPEMYYRIFAAKFLPQNIERILYLDPDLIILKNLENLYSTNLENNYFAAASHVGKSLQRLNEIRLQMESKGPYINSGVMLMNINLLRKEQNFDQVFEYIKNNKNILFLPDQDIISAIYSNRIITIDPYIYNMTERMPFSSKSKKNDIDCNWVKNNSAIVHYCGRNKPWKENYKGVLDCFYREYSIHDK